jgi:hypothetical protein
MDSILGRLKTEAWPYAKSKVWPYAKSHGIQTLRRMAAEFAAGGEKAR